MTQPAPVVQPAVVPVVRAPGWLTWLGLLALIGPVGIIVLLGLNDTIPTELWALESAVVGAVAGVAAPGRLP